MWVADRAKKIRSRRNPPLHFLFADKVLRGPLAFERKMLAGLFVAEDILQSITSSAERCGRRSLSGRKGK